MSEGYHAVVVGYGALGQHHARIYHEHPDVKTLTVVDTDEKARMTAAEKWSCRTVATLDEITDSIDFASVVVPTVNHLEIASWLIERSVAVLVEKPIAISVEEGERMVRMAEEKDVILQVGHVERFNAAVRKLGEYLINPLFIESHRLGPLAPRVKDVGVVLDLMIHDLDLILALVKSDLTSCDAVGVPIVTPREDIANARLRFESGCVANVTVSRVTPDRTRKIRFFQPDTYISLDYLKPEIQIYRKVTSALGLPSIDHDVPVLDAKEPLAAELDSFIQAVRDHSKPVVDGHDGVRALKLAEDITHQTHNVTHELLQKQNSS